MPRLRAPLLLAVTLAAALAASGCGSSGNDDGAASTSTGAQATTTTSTAQTTTETTGTLPAAPDASSAPAVSNATNLDEKPKIAHPEGNTPSTLVTKDLVVGKGPAAKAGDTVTVQYVGVSFSDGKEFDASWNTGQPFTFTLGQSEVIQGWDEGVAGMKVGGRRELVIPPSLGYGASGQGSILPNETLVFVVDLKKIG